MPLDNVQQRILAAGYDCYVRIGNNASDAKIIGFTESYSLSEVFQINKANVIGMLMPVSKDVVAYDCTLKLSGFVETNFNEKHMQKIAQSGYDFSNTIVSLIPNAEDFLENGIITKYPYIDFIEKNCKFIVCHAEGITVASSDISVTAKDYVKCNISLEALVAKKYGKRIKL